VSRGKLRVNSILNLLTYPYLSYRLYLFAMSLSENLIIWRLMENGQMQGIRNPEE